MFRVRISHSIFGIMKNRLIYSLIGLMAVSLVGIIFLQAIWISDAFNAGEREYNSHVSDALNAVNDGIVEDEAVLFIEEKFGGVDSLLREIMVFHPDTSGTKRLFIHENEPGESEQRIEIRIGTDDSSPPSMARAKVESDQRKMVWNQTYEFHFEELDSLVEASTGSMPHPPDVRRVTNVVRQMTTERIFDGNLRSRISPDVLKKKIARALRREGIRDGFEFAVYDHFNRNYPEEFKSTHYATKDSLHDFSKPLFEKDRIYNGQFSLHVQPHNQDGYVWRKMGIMVSLSVVFSLLIILCFVYAIHFIFKQKKISQVKNDFINNMTHELKTPLASISLAASSIRHPQVISRQEEITRLSTIISDEERRIHKHIEQVLEIASMDRSELRLNYVDTDLVHVVREAIRTIELSLHDAGGHLQFDTQTESAPVRADVLHLTNVFTNILDNSVKYRRGTLKIQVEMRKVNGYYEVRITDNGIGMRPAECKQAFDRFYRAETGDIHTIKGFGLGLSYVRSVVEAHQGEVELISEWGKGTTVCIRIPLRP